MKPFNTIGHFNLKVRDLQASIDFYTSIGFPEFLRLTETDGSPWIVYLRITDDLYIELLPNGKGRAGDQVATGLNHLCLTTRDIEATGREIRVDRVARAQGRRVGVIRIQRDAEARGCRLQQADGVLGDDVRMRVDSSLSAHAFSCDARSAPARNTGPAFGWMRLVGLDRLFRPQARFVDDVLVHRHLAREAGTKMHGAFGHDRQPELIELLTDIGSGKDGF